VIILEKNSLEDEEGEYNNEARLVGFSNMDELVET